MIRRHPHVFGDDQARSAGVAKGFWEANKAKEREALGKPSWMVFLPVFPWPCRA
jgi:uncharacterized protein YabN with tetrapyrrole methylase and pyrophosphatase domain